MTCLSLRRYLCPLAFLLLASAPALAQPKIDLLADKLAAWKGKHGDWQEIDSVELDGKNPRKFTPKPGKGVWYNGPKGRTANLYTKQRFADVELHLEFNIPKGSNSGIKFHGHYEIQIDDSFGRKTVSGEHCGGVYPRAAVIKGRYTHLDKGIPPRINACNAPGTWQTLDVTFLAPRFDAKGKKVANAKIARAVLNGKVIHENQELLTPTGDRWVNAEMREGPLMLQADHGPIAVRNFWARTIN